MHDDTCRQELGLLYVVATPIGNLGDFSPRARQVLASVAAIAAEDTRHTRNLLAAHGLRARLVACHEHNEEQVAHQLLLMLREGRDVALVSDAGTPGIADPGARLVAMAHAGGVPVRAVPGPSALAAALSVAGAPAAPVRFLGFAPSREQDLLRMFETLVHSDELTVCLVAPRRLVTTVKLLTRQLGAQRRLCVVREISKMHERQLRGTASEVCSALVDDDPRGETVLLIWPAERTSDDETRVRALPEPVCQLLEVVRSSAPPARLARLVANATGASRNDVYLYLTTGLS